MSIIRCLARPLLAASFINTGITILRDPQQQAEWVGPMVAVTGPLHLPINSQTFLRVNGAVLVAAGGLLALGRLPRFAALALATTSAPATCAEIIHRKEDSPEQRSAQLAQSLARLGLIGGALLTAVDTSGRPETTWPGRHTGERLQRSPRRCFPQRSGHRGVQDPGKATDGARSVARTGRRTNRKAHRATGQAHAAGTSANRRTLQNTADALL